MNKVSLEPFYIIGIWVRTTNQNGRAVQEIGDLWERFRNGNISETIPNKTDNAVYSVYTDYESDHTEPYTAILGCRVKNLDTVPEGMVGKSFEGGNYIKLSAGGDLMKGLIADKWAEIWEMDLDRVFTADFEFFGDKAQNPADAEIDFFIAVK